jgi:hypothetical protein
MIARVKQYPPPELHLDLDVDASREAEVRQRVDDLRGRNRDIDQALVDPHLELLARVLVDEGCPVDGEFLDFRRQGHRTNRLTAITFDRVDDLLSRLVDDLVIVSAKLDTDPLI